jgi:branched-chain amino acid transport system ATP-binding protein
VQDIERSTDAINRDENMRVLLVEQNSRMALRISQPAYTLTMGTIALSENSADLLKDDRVKALYLGGEL